MNIDHIALWTKDLEKRGFSTKNILGENQMRNIETIKRGLYIIKFLSI